MIVLASATEVTERQSRADSLVRRINLTQVMTQSEMRKARADMFINRSENWGSHATTF